MHYITQEEKAQNYFKKTLWNSIIVLLGLLFLHPFLFLIQKLVFLNIIKYGNASFLINDLAHILFSHNYTLGWN